MSEGTQLVMLTLLMIVSSFFNSVVSQPDCPLWILKLYCKHRPEDLPPSHRTTELK